MKEGEQKRSLRELNNKDIRRLIRRTPDPLRFIIVCSEWVRQTRESLEMKGVRESEWGEL